MIYQHPPDRIGDLAVASDARTALGKSRAKHDLSVLAGPLRSHGGRHEQIVPVIVSHPLAPRYAEWHRNGVQNSDIHDLLAEWSDVDDGDRDPCDRDPPRPAAADRRREVWGAERFDVRYPYTGEVIGSAPKLTPEQVAGVLDDAAGLRFDLSRHERAQILNRIADRLQAEEADFARLITLESGLCLKDTSYELRRAQDVFRFAAIEALRDDGQVFACDTSANGKNRRAYTLREPLRLVAAITPFNHPLNQVAHKVAPAIATNNTMVLKPSGRTPLSALRLARVMREAGLPDGMVTMVTGEAAAIGPVMWTHPAVELVSLTGGTEIGKRVAREMGYRRAILELGGNDPLLVLADADLDEAVRLAPLRRLQELRPALHGGQADHRRRVAGRRLRRRAWPRRRRRWSSAIRSTRRPTSARSSPRRTRSSSSGG